MAKVKRELVVENGMHFDEILAFKTESCVGIWDQNNGEFVVMRAGELTLDAFETVRIEHKNCRTLQSLDDIVYEEVNEHIEEVFDEGHWSFEFVPKER